MKIWRIIFDCYLLLVILLIIIWLLHLLLLVLWLRFLYHDFIFCERVKVFLIRFIFFQTNIIKRLDFILAVLNVWFNIVYDRTYYRVYDLLDDIHRGIFSKKNHLSTCIQNSYDILLNYHGDNLLKQSGQHIKF